MKEPIFRFTKYNSDKKIKSIFTVTVVYGESDHNRLSKFFNAVLVMSSNCLCIFSSMEKDYSKVLKNKLQEMRDN